MHTSEHLSESQAAFLCPTLKTLKTRSEFLRASKARYRVTKGLSLQGHPREAGEDDCTQIHVGFTCSKKVGNAVARNRAKRRLRALARQVLPEYGRAGWTYVLIGRRETTASLDFSELERELVAALSKVHT